MDSRQITYCAALLLITALAWRQWRIMAVLWVNLAITLASVLAVDLGLLTAAQAAIRAAWGDLACAIILLSMGGLGRVVGYLCLPMPICILAGFTLGYGSYDAYTLAYYLGYIQLAIVWVGNGTTDNDRRGSGGGGGYRGRGGFRGVTGGGLLHFAWGRTCAKVDMEEGGWR